MTTLDLTSQVWSQRKGRRSTDAPVPNTTQTFEIADDLRQLIRDDATRDAVGRILKWMPRGEDIELALGFFPSPEA